MWTGAIYNTFRHFDEIIHYINFILSISVNSLCSIHSSEELYFFNFIICIVCPVRICVYHFINFIISIINSMLFIYCILFNAFLSNTSLFFHTIHSMHLLRIFHYKHLIPYIRIILWIVFPTHGSILFCHTCPKHHLKASPLDPRSVQCPQKYNTSWGWAVPSSY